MTGITLTFPHGARGEPREVRGIIRLQIDGGRLTYWCDTGMSSGIVLNQMTGPVTMEVE